ncbi:MAG: GAF domain-containing protein [Chloroflexi bacterium]|nr:GAF domain-containing protein [Chloroflexota bacterium]
MNIYAVVPLLGLFAYASLIFLSLSHPRRAERRAFALYLASAALWSLISFLLHLDYAFFREHVLVGSKVLTLALMSMTVTYYCFVRVFVQRPARRGLYYGVAWVLLAAFLMVLGITPREARASGGILYIEHGLALWLYPVGGIVLVVAAAHSLVDHYRELSTPLARTRVGYLIIGLGVVTAAALTNLHPALLPYPIDQMGNLGNALIISYAILRYQLLDIKLLVRRALAYTTLSMFLTTGYLLVLYVLIRVSPLSLSNSLAPAAVLALVMALAFVSLREMAQERVDRLFYPHTYRYRKMLLEFSRQAGHFLTLEQLSGEAVHLIIRAFRARWGALLFPDTVGGDLRLEYGGALSPDLECPRLRLRQDNPLVVYMTRGGAVLRVENLESLPQEKGLWEVEREELRSSQVALLCPIVTRGTLTGIIALGPRQEGLAYAEEEIELLLAVASGAAGVMENARMVASLQQREEVHDHLLSRLIFAQEQERQRIAAELHDGVAQWLVRASYQAQVLSALAARQGNGLRQELSSLEGILDSSIKELRRILGGLRPPSLEELGLPGALRKELDDLEREGLSPHMEISGEPVPLSPPVEIAAYRIVQESLNNARRHSQASHVALYLHFGGGSLHVEVRDDGVGFDVPNTLRNAVSHGHLGLLGMKERVESLGGELHIASGDKGGTCIAFQVPVSYVEGFRPHGHHTNNASG